MESSIPSPKYGWFENVAAAYSKNRPQYPKSLFSWISSQASSLNRCWDGACGSGQASIGLAKYFDRVDANDLSPKQIALAPAHPRIHYKVAAAESSGLPDKSIDVIVIAAAIHWLDVPRFNIEAMRVIRPGGLMTWVGYEPLQVAYSPLQAWLDELYSERLKSFWPKERKHVDSKYIHLPFPAPNKAIPKGLSIPLQWSCHDLMGFVGTWSALRKLHNESNEILINLKTELQAIWPEGQKNISLKMPLMGRWGYLS